MATDADGNRGNYEHVEEMHGSCPLATSSTSDHRYLGTEAFPFSLDILFHLGQLLDRIAPVVDESTQH